MLSLRTRLIATFIAVAALPLAMFWAWPQSRAMERQINDVQGKHLLIARNLGTALERYHKDIVSTFDYFARSLARGEVVRNADELLIDLKFRHVCVAKIPSGRVVHGMLRDRVKCPAEVPPKRFAKFRKIAVAGQTVMTGVLPNPNGQPTIYFVRNESDKLIIGAIGTGYFVELGKQISFGVRGHAAIVDQFGKVLSHPLPHWTAQMKDISKVSTVQRMLRGENGVQAFYSPALKDDMIAGFTSVKGAGWGVMIPQPMAELRSAANEIRASSMMVFALGVGLAFIVSLVMANSITGHCRTLYDRAKQALSGQMAPPLPLLSGRTVPTEYKQLAIAVDELGVKIAHLEAARITAEDVAKNARSAAEQGAREVAGQLSNYVDRIDGLSNLLACDVQAELDTNDYRDYAVEINECSKALAATITTMSTTPEPSGTGRNQFEGADAQPAFALAQPSCEALRQGGGDV